MKKELILIFGGRSGEHEVSLRSAASVYNHLDREKYNITLIGIANNGCWFKQDNPQKNIESLLIDTSESRIVSIIPMKGFTWGNSLLNADIVFPVIHGTFGEDGTLQGLLEMSGFPYAGATVGGSYMGMDKDVSKSIWTSHGIDVIPYSTVKTWEYVQDERIKINKNLINKFGLPLFVKPSMAGSSVGVTKVDKAEQLSDAILKALRFDTKALIEPAITGREIECSVIGNDKTESFPPGEIAPTHNFYDYEAKYLDPDGARLIIPAKITEEQSRNLRHIAEKAYKALELKGFARVDFFIEENSGRILLNEVNTIPGFTNISMFSKMCEVGGLPYSKLLDRLIEMAEEQYENRMSLKFSYD
ncbi:MAG: D-alanine--D-alanine ligase [Spirochaetaceae bacterium]|jgi:D-alanine-D-alanine ligase|nr:D-alanine--D-alanine ligase [Spirochaetaceae bacterium]